MSWDGDEEGTLVPNRSAFTRRGASRTRRARRPAARLTARMRPRGAPQKLVCGDTVRPCTCYFILSVCLVTAACLAVVVADAAVRTSSAMVQIEAAAAAGRAAAEPLALHRDVVAGAMVRAGQVLNDPRVKELDIAAMVVASSLIEQHVANISTALDVVLRRASDIVQDPRVQAVDWPGHVANLSAVATWASDAHLGTKIETGLTEIDDLLLRLVHAATAMAAFSAPDTGG